MTLDEIKQLIEFIKSHDLSEFELEQDGVKIRIKDGNHHQVVAVPHIPATMPIIAAAPIAAPSTPANSSPPAPPATDEAGELCIVKSPIVGTFYRAAEPGAKPFASVGDTVRKGQVLCIIEAMKLMNEIDSEYDGEITNIYVENGQAVQYGERLFAIKPSN